MISATGSGKSGTPRKGEPLFLFPAGDRPQEPQEGREQAEGLPGGEITAGASEGQNRPQSAATGAE